MITEIVSDLCLITGIGSFIGAVFGHIGINWWPDTALVYGLLVIGIILK